MGSRVTQECVLDSISALYNAIGSQTFNVTMSSCLAVCVASTLCFIEQAQCSVGKLHYINVRQIVSYLGQCCVNKRVDTGKLLMALNTY